MSEEAWNFHIPLDGLDHGVGHPIPSGLSQSSSRRTEGSRRNLTAAKIAANIDRGFCPKNRSAAVVPSGRVRKKL